jgi:ligand-binding sensor domain-containing protein
MRSFRVASAVWWGAFFFTGISLAQGNLWQSHTNMREVVDFVSVGSDLWAATTGGLLHWQSGDSVFEKITNTEGLDVNSTTAIGKDERGHIWLGLDDGLINVYDPVSQTVSRIDDYRGFQVKAFLAQSDSMLIALNVGVSLYLINRREVKETYKSLGSLPPQTAVQNLFIRGRELWVATVDGIARTSLDFANLLAPQSWTNYYSAHGLPSVDVRAFAAHGGNFYAATALGVVKWTGTTWINISGNIGDLNILDLATAADGTLYAATLFRVARMASEGEWSLVATQRPLNSKVLVTEAGTVWVGTEDVGFLEYQTADNSWIVHEPDGPGSNNFTSLALDAEGNLWCTSTDRGISIFNGQRWRNYNQTNGAFWNDYRSVWIDQAQPNTRWFGTWGRGIVRATGDLDNLQFVKYDTANGFLANARSAPLDYVVATFVKQDMRNTLWITNFDATNGSPIAFLDTDGRTGHFSTNDGLRSMLVTAIEIDNANRVWVASDNAGVSVIDHNNTLFDRTDDRQGQELDNDDGLASVRVTSLAEDQDGIMWIGTDQGLNSWFPRPEPVSSHFGLISDDIRVVRVDPQNNKWIGTSAGISVLSGKDNFSLSEFTIQNSPLVSNSITSFAFNENTGEVYIGTTNGLSVYRSPFVAPRTDFSQLKGYPNPLLLGRDGGTFRITNLTKLAQVKIFDEIGRLVRAYGQDDIPGGFVVWDGKNEDGNIVGSGIYLIVAYNDEGQSAVGKVAVISQ